MKKGWQIVCKILDLFVWLWSKIKPSIEKKDNDSINPIK